MFAVLLYEHFNLLGLLKRGLQLGEEDALNGSQLHLDLILLLAHVDRVKSFEVLQVHIAKVDHGVFLVLGLVLRLSTHLCRVCRQLHIQVTNDRVFTLRLRLQLEELLVGGVEVLRNQLLQLFLDLVLKVSFERIEAFQFVLSQ